LACTVLRVREVPAFRSAQSRTWLWWS